MNRIGFYLMNQKGFTVLCRFIKEFSTQHIAYVVGCRDKNVQKDYFDEIKNICDNNEIKFFYRTEQFNEKEEYKVAIGWRWLIPEQDNLIVLHDSLLPKYRGFAPLVNMLVNGENEIGVTALKASDSYDAGDIIDQKIIKIEYPIKIQQAIDLISPLYGDLVCSIFEKISNNTLEIKKQNDQEATYSLWLNQEDYRIDWNWDSEKICRFIDAVGFPYEGATTIAKDEKIIISEAEIIPDCQIEDRKRHIGKIIFMNDSNKPIIIAGKGLVKINKAIDSKGEPYKFAFRTKLV